MHLRRISTSSGPPNRGGTCDRRFDILRDTSHHCSLCDDVIVEVEVGLNRALWNALLTSFGSSELQIRLKNRSWITFMKPWRGAKGLYCTRCGALTVAPSIAAHRKELGLDP